MFQIDFLRGVWNTLRGNNECLWLNEIIQPSKADGVSVFLQE